MTMGADVGRALGEGLCGVRNAAALLVRTGGEVATVGLDVAETLAVSVLRFPKSVISQGVDILSRNMQCRR